MVSKLGSGHGCYPSPHSKVTGFACACVGALCASVRVSVTTICADAEILSTCSFRPLRSISSHGWRSAHSPPGPPVASHPRDKGHLGCFQGSAFMNKAVMSACDLVFLSLGKMLRSLGAGQLRTCTFSFLRSCQIPEWLFHRPFRRHRVTASLPASSSVGV